MPILSGRRNKINKERSDIKVMQWKTLFSRVTLSQALLDKLEIHSIFNMFKNLVRERLLLLPLSRQGKFSRFSKASYLVNTKGVFKPRYSGFGVYSVNHCITINLDKI